MKKHSQYIIFAGLIGCLMSVSCNKPDPIELANEGTLYMPQAAGTRAKIDLQLSTEPQDITFGAAYGGLNVSGTEIPVTFTIDSSLVSSYNNDNGTSYTLLPAGSYTISGLSSVIPAGKTSSDPLTLSVSSDKVPFGTRFMLPITLQGSGKELIDPALQTTYFRFDTILRKSVDVTNNGTLSVNHENPGGPDAGEGSNKLVDNDINTKYLFFDYAANDWFQISFTEPTAIGAYNFTSANDASSRDPKTWTLEGSDDGVNWTVLDSREDQYFASRFQTVRYEIAAGQQSFKNYRIVLAANNGSSLFQMSEWRLFRYE